MEHQVAVVQMASVAGDVAGNVAHSLELIHRAARMGARLVVLPELCNTGYDLSDAAAASSLAEPVPGGYTYRKWESVCKELDIHLVAGICEREGDCVYNSAVFLGPSGLLGTYRKAHLFYREKELFVPGNVGFPVWETPLGRIGILICYDLRFPEAVRSLALAGADCIAVPTAWVTLAGPAADERGICMQAYCAMAHASMNQVVIACASAIGPYQDRVFLGNSLICGVTGWPLAGPAPSSGEVILTASVDVEAIRTSRQRNPYNHTFADRRTDLYGPVAGRGMSR